MKLETLRKKITDIESSVHNQFWKRYSDPVYDPIWEDSNRQTIDLIWSGVKGNILWNFFEEVSILAGDDDEMYHYFEILQQN